MPYYGYQSEVRGYSLAAVLGEGDKTTLRKGQMLKKVDGRYYWTFNEPYGGRIHRYSDRPQRWFYGASKEQHEFLSSLPKEILVNVSRERGRVVFQKYTPPKS